MSMKIRDSYAIHILSLFRYSDFRDKSESTIRNILSGHHPKSELPLLPKPENILVNNTDELSTDVEFVWEDCKFKYTFLWKKGLRGDNYLLVDMV